MADEKTRECTQPVWVETLGTDVAPAEYTWVCAACGKTSRSRYGFDSTNTNVADPCWDESCMLNAVLCHSEKAADGKWRAVES